MMEKTKLLLIALSSTALLACLPQQQEFPADIQEDMANIGIANAIISTCDGITRDSVGFSMASARIERSATINHISVEALFEHYDNTNSIDDLMVVERAVFYDYYHKAGLADGREYSDTEFTQKFCAQAIKEDQQNTKIGQLFIVN